MSDHVRSDQIRSDQPVHNKFNQPCDMIGLVVRRLLDWRVLYVIVLNVTMSVS